MKKNWSHNANFAYTVKPSVLILFTEKFCGYLRFTIHTLSCLILQLDDSNGSITFLCLLFSVNHVKRTSYIFKLLDQDNILCSNVLPSEIIKELHLQRSNTC